MFPACAGNMIPTLSKVQEAFEESEPVLSNSHCHFKRNISYLYWNMLVMYCMYIPGFIVTSADISQLWVYLCYSLIYCLRLFVVVYKLVMFMERG